MKIKMLKIILILKNGKNQEIYINVLLKSIIFMEKKKNIKFYVHLVKKKFVIIVLLQFLKIGMQNVAQKGNY